MIDDTSDKVRRNLVVFSFLITLSQVFEFEPQTEITILDGVSLQMNSPIKFWLVITALLIYLFFRYWFDNTRVDHLSQLHKESRLIKERALTALLKRDLINTLKLGTKSKIFSDVNQLEAIKTAFKTNDKPIQIKPSLDFYDPFTSTVTNFNSPTGRTSARFEFTWKDQTTQTVSAKDPLQFHISRFRYGLLCCKGFFKLCTLTKSNFDFIIPVVLAIFALLICLIKISRLVLT